MEHIKEDLKLENPESGANILSRIFFIWAIPLVKKLLKDFPLYFEFPVLLEDRADNLGQRLECLWEKEVNLSTRSIPILWDALTNIFGKKKKLYDILLFFNYVVLRPMVCILLAVLIRTFREEYTLSKRCIFGAAFVFTCLIIFITEHSVHFHLNKIGMRMRVALSSLIYRKTLKLSLPSLKKLSTENVLKLLSEDLPHFQRMATFGSQAPICIIQFIVTATIMWAMIGFPSLAGILFIIIVIYPINSTCFNLQKTQKSKMNTSKERRVKFIKEIIKGTRTIKMNNWEKPFENIIKLTRQLELESVYKYMFCHLTFFSFFTHKLCTFLSIISLFYFNKYLLPEQVFPCSLFLFMSLIGAMYWIPKSIKSYEVTQDILGFITNLLLMKEVKQFDSLTHEKPEIKLERVCVHWSAGNDFDLRIDNIRIKPGSLCIVIGPQNAGKSTFLKLILKELLPRCGKVHTMGSVSYCSQNPWLYNSSIRNNILFGRLYRETKYKNVINACNLLPDYSQFMNGDLSGVGPGGVNLGDDQKSRIHLARAVYHEADIYLIDDVLSLMDAENSQKLFDDCFTRYLARKTRVVVTNQIQFFDKADHIVVVSEGKAQIFDNLTQVKESKIDLYEWIEDPNGNKKIIKQNLETKWNIPEFNDSEDIIEGPDVHRKSNQAISEYIKSGHFFFFTCFILFLSQAFITCCDYWLAYWTSQPYVRPKSYTKIHSFFSNPFSKTNTTSSYKIVKIQDAHSDVLVYSFLILGSALLIALSNGLLMNFFITAARKLHENMSYSVLRAPMSFFQSNSLTKIFKSFTLDVEVVDRKFPDASQQTIEVFLCSIGCLVLVYTSDSVLIVSVALVILYLIIQNIYLEVSKILTSLETKAYFPILSHMMYTLQGVLTIRVHEGQIKSIAQFDKLLDHHSSLYRLKLATTFSFKLWSHLLCNIFLAVTIFGLILVHEYVHPVDPTYVGLAVLQVYQLSEILQYGSKKLIQSEQATVSINKIIEYSKLQAEQSAKKKYHDSLEFSSKSKLSVISMGNYKLTPENWPEDGVIEFRNVTLTYADKIQALDDVNFQIKAQEKIGIVGKPGSGKSSIVAAIFNLHDFDGTIIIDKIDTKLVVLESLRKSISIIQEPMLFSECIAYNLDPLGHFSEKELWDVLDEVNLKQYIDSLCELTNPDTNKFTKSQILLLCLAREILRKNKIIIFDDISENLDEETEELFYRVVKKHFTDCTVLYITSNLNPIIMECDRVLVMEKGQIVDYDHPFSLLESEGAFYRLVLEAGKSVYSHYRHLAYQQYVQKFRTNAVK